MYADSIMCVRARIREETGEEKALQAEVAELKAKLEELKASSPESEELGSLSGQVDDKERALYKLQVRQGCRSSGSSSCG